MVEHVGSSQSTSAFRFLAALVWTGFLENTCAGKCSECSTQSTRIFQTHYDLVRAECSRLASEFDSVTEHWKRPRTENYSKSFAGNKSPTTHAERFYRSAEKSLDGEEHFVQAPKKRATSVTTMLAETNLNGGILDELAERLGNFHESARALADCLQTRDVTRKTDESTMEAAKCMFHKLLGEASDDLERVTSQSRKGLHIETTRNAHRCSHSETASERKSCRSRRHWENNTKKRTLPELNQPMHHPIIQSFTGP